MPVVKNDSASRSKFTFKKNIKSSSSSAQKSSTSRGSSSLSSSATSRNVSNATKTVKSTQSAGSGFAPSSRPGVITRSGNTIFKNGKLVGNYNTKEAADSAYNEFTGQSSSGKIRNIAGDNSGETYRQLYRVDQGKQTGQANTSGIKKAIQSYGFQVETGVDAQGNERILGAQTPKTVQKIQNQQRQQRMEEQKIAREQQKAYVAGQPWSRQAPVLQDKAKEDEARSRIAQERGIDLNNATASQRMLLNEAVNTDVYGMARPNFQKGADVLSAGQKTQEQILASKQQNGGTFSIPENLNTGINETIVTSKGAETFTNEQLAKFQEYNQENSDEVVSSLDSLIESDPDILAAQESGDDMQALLEQQRQFYEEQYNQLKDEIQAIYDAKEADYEEQAAIAMGAAVSQMASIGAFGVTTSGMRYIDSVNRENQAKILALASEEAAALNSAYSAFMEADFGIAEKMINTAKSTREEIRAIKADNLQRQKTLMELKQMEREDVGQTVTAIANAGMTAADLPTGYLEYLDQKSGYPSGTTSKLLNIVSAQAEQSALQASYEANIKRANDYIDIASKLPVGTTMQVGDSLITSINTGTITSGTEEVDGRMYYWQKNQDTGELIVQDMGVHGSMKYEDYTDENGRRIRTYENGTSQVVWDPAQPNGGVATGGILDMFPTGSTGGQCGAWVNDLMNTAVGDSFESKMAFTDSSITADTAQVGDMFVQNVGEYGHVGIITGKSTINGEIVFTVSESNWNLDEKVTHGRPVKASEIAGFGRPGWRNQAYAFNNTSTQKVELSDVERSFAQRYASALTESERSSVLSQADSAGVSVDRLVEGALTLIDQLPSGIVYNTSTGLAASLPEKVSNDLTSNMSSVQGIFNIFDQYVKGGDTFEGGGTGMLQGRLPSALLGKGSETIQDFISALELKIRNENFGASLTESEKEAAKAAIPSITSSDAKNVRLLRQLTTSLVTGMANYLRQRGYSVSGYTVPIRNPETGDVMDIPLHLFNPNEFELAL